MDRLHQPPKDRMPSQQIAADFNMTSISRRDFLLLSATAGVGVLGLPVLRAFGGSEDRFREYVEAVTSGEGYLPWQERGYTEAESLFRERMEARKTRLVQHAGKIKKPVFLTEDDVEQIRNFSKTTPQGRRWFAALKKRADYLLRQPSSYVEEMIPRLTPTSGYGWTCPHCVGHKSQEGHGSYKWSYREPDVLVCRSCGHQYPDEQYPETARLVCPRNGQALTFYLNRQERANPADRSGNLAYKWANGLPVHVSFSGVIRVKKAQFMISGAQNLALIYQLTGHWPYAERAKDILIRLATCYRHWLYHDYRGTFADCDPLYAAWHDQALPLAFKRHLCTNAYKKDTDQKARMLQTYWGAGRLWPSTDTIGTLATIATAYDLTRHACNGEDRPLWDSPSKDQVERDLILEYLMGAEPFAGGPNRASNWSNKSPRVYYAMAVVGGVLHASDFARTALKGLVAVLDHAFLPDGFSRQSPGYTDMYLGNLSRVLPALEKNGALGDKEAAAIKSSHDRLETIYRTLFDQLRPNGTYFPLADTQLGRRPSPFIIENAVVQYPSLFEAGDAGGEKKTLRQPPKTGVNLGIPFPRKDLGTRPLPEVYFPSWMTAILRHQVTDRKSAVALTFSPYGKHRHRDNLALFYEDDGDTILGDHGYIASSPINRWSKSTFSHNLVIVDNQEQAFKERQPSLHRMFTSPEVSAVEASSKVYSQCSEYRRLVVLFKEPDGATFLVDIFRISGGRIHDYRVFSEIASSDDAQGSMSFSGLRLPEIGPLEKGSATLNNEEIFGLRDAISAKDPPAVWQAVWRGENRAYRLSFLSQVDEVVVSHGPGQETKEQVGRRLGYLDAVRRGSDLNSVFVGVHEPLDMANTGSIRGVERIDGIEKAGLQALALKMHTRWGTYLLLNHFDSKLQVQGVKFQGKLAILGETFDGKIWGLASEAETFMYRNRDSPNY